MAIPELSVMLLTLAFISLLTPQESLAQDLFYPEDRSDLQKYQDSSRCYPDVGDWYLMYRNYYSDAHFGGTAKCVKYSKVGKYENFTSQAIVTYAGQGSTTGQLNLDSGDCYVAKDKFGYFPDDPTLPPISFYLIYTDCVTCSVIRHRYAGDGYGCTYWRRTDALQQPDDCCEFIYAENCGSSPKYQIYDSSCRI